MILLEVPSWFAQVFGIGFSLIAFLLSLILLFAVFMEYVWEHSQIYKTIFYAMWTMERSRRDWFEITWNGKTKRWKEVKE